MINLFFIVHDNSGAKTYANELLNYLSFQKDIIIHKVYLESNDCDEYTVKKEDNGMTIIIPAVNRKMGTLEKYAARCIDLMSPLLQNRKNIIFHLNSSTHVKIGLQARKRYNAKLVYTLHYLRNYFSSFALGTHNPKEVCITGDDIDKEIANQADQIICVTRFASDMLHLHYSIPLSKLHVIYNGVGKLDGLQSDSNEKIKENIRQQLGFQADSKLFLFVGRLILDKGVEKLLEVFNRISTDYPKSRLILVGDGDCTPFMAQVHDNIGRVSFTGKLPYEKVVQLYTIADIGVIPSEFEQCSYVALEMMKHGLPIIASAVPGMGELFEHQRNALLISVRKRQDGQLGPELNDDSLYEKIKLLLNDKALAKKIAKNARENWKLNFTAERMGRETISTYKKCLPQQQIRCNLKVMIQ